MTRLSPDFQRHEFRCRDGCGLDTVDAELVDVLQLVRDHFGVPVIVNSGHRCERHNREVGGGEFSQHLYGRAADIVVLGVPVQEFYDKLNSWYPKKLGLGLYETFVHVDTRTDGPARWSG